MPKNAFAKSQNRLDDPVPVAGVYGPTTGLPPETWYDKAEQLSYGLGAGGVRQLEGYKQLLTHPVQSVREMAAGLLAVAKDPSVAANALSGLWGRATASPEGFGSVVGENLNPRNLLRNMTRPNVREITTYHGTPHRFPATESNPLGEFDASKIGTGEGAQAYGHGLYVAESPDVAGSYIRSNPIDVEHLARTSGLGQLSREAQVELRRAANINEKSADAAAKTAQNANRELRGLDSLSISKVIDQIRSNSKGSLYHVDLPDPMIEKMLDWDKPLSEQPKNVKDYFQKRGYTDKDWSAALYMKNEGDPDVVSSILREAGIPGIRYLDAGSRDGAKNTRNFVIFPGEEKNLKILKRE